MHWLDPNYLPKTKGKIKRFLINPHGEIDGLILSGDREIHFPPHMSSSLARVAKIGQSVTVRGVKPRGSDVIAGVSIEAGSKRVVDDGPPDDHKEKRKGKGGDSREDEAEGTVTQVLHGPKGEKRGFLLDGGTIVRFPKHAAKKAHPFLKPGVKVAARGPLVKNKYGSVIDARALGATVRTLRRIDGKPPKHH